MARAWKVHDIRAGASLATVARRVLAVRIAELYSYEAFIHDPARVTELHDMRIAAKRLRYTLEIFRSGFPIAIGPVLDQVKAIQELLGEIHDADVMVDFLQERLTAIAIEDAQQLVELLGNQRKEAARLATITAHVAPGAPDRRIGIAALLGRTLHRRRQRYAEFLDLWAKLATSGFRQSLLDLTQPPPLPEAAAAVAAAIAAGNAASPTGD